jgi:hypothetical protein
MRRREVPEDGSETIILWCTLAALDISSVVRLMNERRLRFKHCFPDIKKAECK